MPVLARYRCLNCGHEWAGVAGPVQPDETLTQCPMCAHVYIKWLNYGETR